MAKEIKDLPATPGLSSTDLLATKQGTADYKATVDQLSTLIRSDIQPQAVMDLIRQVDSNLSGLNATFLQGASRQYFENAGNLVVGTVPDGRLPSGSATSFGTSAWSQRLYLPEFIFNQRLMIQFGVTVKVLENRLVTVTFPTPFVSGYGTSNEPFVQISPMVDDGTGSTSGSIPSSNVQLNMKMHKVTLSRLTLASQRDGGTGGDLVRAFWFAIGKY